MMRHSPTCRRTRPKCSVTRSLLLDRLEDRSLPSFITAPSYPVGLGPTAIVVGDFNSDGAPDLVTGNQDSYDLSVLLGNGDGSFRPPVSYPDVGYLSVATGDFDGNGTVDLVGARGVLGVSVLMGNGDGTFKSAATYAAGSFAGSIAVGDFDGDGAPDLVVANGGAVSVLRGNGDGSFQGPVSSTVDSDSLSVAAGDFNGDGRLDVAVTNSSSNAVSVLLGNGDGSFQAPVSFAVGLRPWSVAVGDFNGDGRLDFTTANTEGNSVSVRLGNGDGSFQALINYAVGLNPRSVTIGDFDGDSHLDLAATNHDSNTVSILPGNGDGTFQAVRAYAVGSLPAQLVAADLDGDGNLDLAVADSARYGVRPADVAVLMGRGDGTFAAPRTYGTALHAAAVEVGDFNEDGVPDPAVATYHGDCVSVLLGRPDGSFEAAANYATGNFTHALVVADFNADGHLDLAVSGFRLDVLLGRGDGSFEPTTFYGAVPTNSDAVVAADLNGDGALDIALTVYNDDSPGAVAVLIGNGDGTFQPATYFTAGYGTYGLAAGDFDEDGNIDLVVTNVFGLAPDKLYILPGNGDGTFRDPVPYGVVSVARSVVVADFDGDAHLDLATANADSANGITGVSVILGNGDGTFRDAVDFPIAYEAWDVAAGDFDADGVADLVLAAPAPGSVSVLRGRGDGTFLAPASYTAGVDLRSVAVGDFNGDGYPDLATTNFDPSTATVLLNAGRTTTVSINQAAGQSDPTAGSTISFDVVFSGPVTGFDATDVDLSASTAGGVLVPTVTGSGSTYTVTVTGMTGPGTVAATIPANAAIDASGVPTLASTSTDNTVTFDNVPPAVTINQGPAQQDPTNASPVTFAVHFSESVTGFDGSDIDFAGSTVGGTLVAAVSGAGRDYTITITGMEGIGTVVASLPAGAAVNALGIASAASTSTDNGVTFDAVPSAVTIDQAADQTDPTNVPSVRFDVRFSEPVTGFDAADVSLAGSTAGGTLSVGVTGSLDTYTVTVTGMTSSGLVVASIPAGAATDGAGNPSLASTSPDNSVEFLFSGTVGFSQAVYATTEDAGVVMITVTRAGGTDGAVSIDYATGDGTAHAGSDYTGTSGTLSWADGEGGDKTFTVPVLQDDLNEGKELIHLALTGPVGSPVLGLVDADVAIAPSDPQGPGTYFDQDGDRYTIRLTGKIGSLLYYRTDPDGDGRGPIELIELTGTLPDPLKPKAALVIAVARAKTSTDGGTVGLGAVTGSGLRAISARKANLTLEGINLSGYLGSLTIGNMTNGADITTLGTASPLQKTRISALAIGEGTSINVGAALSSLAATSFGAGSVRSPSIGTLAIKGDMAADVTVTGAGVDPTKKALGLFRVKGAVIGSDIPVSGNVGAVVVGAFRDSRLFAGYAGPDTPDPAGFNLPSTVTTFRTTGKVDGFDNSRVIATAFKSVTLASLDLIDATGPFGFYADVSLGAVSVTGPTKFKYNAGLPTPQGLGDFEVRIV